MTNSKVKVAVGMSGGVDSSVAAYLLSESGYEVKGIFMKNWEEDDGDECSSKQDYEDARRVCKHLGIELNLVNFSDKFNFRRGRVNCSLNDTDGWRWFGLQFSVKLD